MNEEEREMLQANIKRFSTNFNDYFTENQGADSSHRPSRMQMRNQMSFGKRERQYRPQNGGGGGGGGELDDSGFRSELMMRVAGDPNMLMMMQDGGA